ncbi:UDP-glycosyltransferase 83A1-like [Humulus lupulus]|uniref:UDP-glycosyltransferase 83A1-like n=1 Tax=Humulus lupulus TaxID=3486 RepID=UPI002B40730E|nr:UDP-glycosyltransferase 83A1-like [Humulus lupulus]XP_062082997.1 UDP-glycosyltransferase 83A1-like [Humulus lupulus]
MTSKKRVIVMPVPAQGHVKPLMLLSHKLVKHGLRVTFVNTEFNHNKILSGMGVDDDTAGFGSEIEMVSIPDGLGSMADRTDEDLICDLVWGESILPAEFEKLITTINNGTGGSPDDIISCVVSDYFLSWPLEIAAKLGVKAAVFFPSAAALFLYTMNIPKLIQDGIITSDGKPTKQQMIQLSSGVPTIDTSKLPWNIGNPATQKVVFRGFVNACQSLKMTDWWLCNTSHDIEPLVFSLLPKLLPIGPLMASIDNSPLDIPGSQFWAEDSSCLSWLDQHKPHSVIYIAFGSSTFHDQVQYHELARGLELIGMPFLWVVRPGFILSKQKNGLELYGFESNSNNNNLGKIVNWAPQQKVLSHPAIACFVSHCGWNSTLEGLSNGVPFLTWPYFADQFMDESYICDIWKVGMKFEPNERGIVTSEEVKNKVDKLLLDKDIRRRSLEFKEMIMKSISKDGQSSENVNNLVKWIKET